MTIYSVGLYLFLESGVDQLSTKRKVRNMYNNSFDINVLVNGNRCKIYHHNNGKSYIEAKHGSEYELEIKNNTGGRVVVVSSVDGLNILNGEAASTDGPGYIIPAYSPLRIKGFRYSNEEVAAFKFTSKNNSYAQSVGGSEAAKNCGIIGFVIYDEFVKATVTKYETIPYPVPYYVPTPWHPHPYEPYYCRCSNLIATSNSDMRVPCSSIVSSNTLKDFDMGSTWGQKVESKVEEANFERGNMVLSLDIYYASRDSLISMGVNIGGPPQVSFPQSFPSKYANPPSGWRG